MQSDSPQLGTVLAFVSGAIPPIEFEQALKTDGGFSTLLDDADELPRGSYIRPKKNTYGYLLSLDYEDPGGLVDAMGALTQFLDRRGVEYEATQVYSDTHGLLLDAQPDWMDVDMRFLKEHVLADAPDVKKAELKKWLRARLRELFRYASRPPRWVQNAEWPMRDNRPLVFLGQASIKEYFGDEAAVYLFHDPDSADPEDIVTVLQFW